MFKSSVIATLVAFYGTLVFAQELSICGEARYSRQAYVCYDGDFLCPILNGTATLRCGSGCYSKFQYECNNDQLEPLGQSEPIDQPEPSSQSEPSGATPSGFTVEAVNPEAPFHLKELQGCNNRIVLGLDRPCTFCPTFINVCPPGDKTVFLDGYNLYALVPGGNRLYIEPTGIIGYTQGKSASIPDGSLFGISAYPNGTVTYGGADWRACPIGGSDPPQWEVFADLPDLSFNSSCIAFDGRVKNDTFTEAGAWAYT